MFGITGIYFPEIAFINFQISYGEKTDADMNFTLQEIQSSLNENILQNHV